MNRHDPLLLRPMYFPSLYGEAERSAPEPAAPAQSESEMQSLQDELTTLLTSAAGQAWLAETESPSLAARHDQQTGLQSLAAFRGSLGEMLADAAEAGGRLAVMCVRIDNLDSVTETFKPGCESLIMGELVWRLRAFVRRSCAVCRSEHDEFRLAVEIDAEHGAERTAARLLALIRQPLQVGGDELHMTATIGISLFPAHSDKTDTLLSHALYACRFGRRSGRDNYCLHEESASSFQREKAALEAGLYRALKNGELMLYFQPLLGLSNGAPVGAEALLRWRLPDGRFVSPRTLIDVAEETQLIQEVGA